MKLKFRCHCGKRMLTDLSAIGRSSTCKRCNAAFQVPEPASPRVIALICDCQIEVPIGATACPACGEAVPKIGGNGVAPEPTTPEKQAPPVVIPNDPNRRDEAIAAMLAQETAMAPPSGLPHPARARLVDIDKDEPSDPEIKTSPDE